MIFKGFWKRLNPFVFFSIKKNRSFENLFLKFFKQWPILTNYNDLFSSMEKNMKSTNIYNQDCFGNALSRIRCPNITCFSFVIKEIEWLQWLFYWFQGIVSRHYSFASRARARCALKNRFLGNTILNYYIKIRINNFVSSLEII